ncbi:MAG: hypothetical protein ACTSQE_15310 [Candidatus Heimdallarchaeaceae archaeon]
MPISLKKLSNKEIVKIVFIEFMILIIINTAIRSSACDFLIKNQFYNLSAEEELEIDISITNYKTQVEINQEVLGAEVPELAMTCYLQNGTNFTYIFIDKISYVTINVPLLKIVLKALKSKIIFQLDVVIIKFNFKPYIYAVRMLFELLITYSIAHLLLYYLNDKYRLIKDIYLKEREENFNIISAEKR